MRIKCPNSDIVLELPGDRTDMKFTCPACRKVHRVTVSITTPGEDPPPPKVNSATSMTRIQPHMPKKYATGAFAPVVDVPIDANFVLLDSSSVGQDGVDLGRAADPRPSQFGKDLSERKTEIIDRRPSDALRPQPEPPRTTPSDENIGIFEENPFVDDVSPMGRADSEETTRDDDDASESRRLWEQVKERHRAAAEAPQTPPPPSPPPPEAVSDQGFAFAGAGIGEAVKPKKRGRVAPVIFLALIVLAAAGFLGWQQYLYNAGRDDAAKLLTLADSAWERGDADSAANAARNADVALGESRRFHTAGKLWHLFSSWAGIGSSSPSPDGMERKIQGYLEREKALASFRASLDPSNTSGTAELIRDVTPSTDRDPALLAAMQKIAMRSTIGRLKSDAENLPPETARTRAWNDLQILEPVLSTANRDVFAKDVSDFDEAQRNRVIREVKEEICSVASLAASGNAGAIQRFRAVEDRVRRVDIPELSGSLVDMGEQGDRESLRQLSDLSAVVGKAVEFSQTVLSLPGEDEAEVYKQINTSIDDMMREAGAIASPHRAMAEAASNLVDATRGQADDLLGLRINVGGRLQSEMRRNRDYAGTRLAWFMLRMAFDDNKIAIDPAQFRYDSNRAAMDFVFDGIPASMSMGEDDYEKCIRVTIGEYTFTTGWAILFHKPVAWMAEMARAMRSAHVDAARYPDWELFEGPGGPLALSISSVGSGVALANPAVRYGRQVFFQERQYQVIELPTPEDSLRMVENFRLAAERLHDRVMSENTISQSLRQALKPILMGTYQQPDPRDYFDSAFCRRLIEADYLETYIAPMPDAIARRLEEYREALDKLEAGYDVFAVDLEDGGRLYAVARPDADIAGGGKASDQDPETGETVPRFTWRVEKGSETVFYSPQPARFVYAFMLAEHYDGIHKSRPAGVPKLSEVWHVTHGRLASYRDGDAGAEGDSEQWSSAIAEDSSGRFDPTIGPAGWNYPLHVLQRDDQGDPVLLATLSGTVKSPDFSGILDDDERRAAEDEWLDSTAKTLATPGELGLIFHQFFRYCSDSPMPELPNLIGSHFGLSDTHQTVYESLERRWVGRLIGDCDDLAEFFQVLTRRQGKLSHVMQLPGHAAAGWVEPNEAGGYRFAVLQTGPVLQFNAPTLNDVVEMAYRSFDRGEGISHMTTDAVPLLLRFADEETRTPFVLSARIYGDAEYADTMIEVQGYWHEHVYSAAIKVMEELVKVDQEIGNIKELGSLYERVGFYDRSAEMRRKELEMVRDENQQAAISTLLELTQLYFQEKNPEKALEALGEMETIMRKMVEDGDAGEFFRAMTFRSFWAMYMSRLGQTARAWDLVGYDVIMTKRQLGRVAEPVLRTLVIMYERMCMERDAAGGDLPAKSRRAMDAVRRELDEAFGRGYFKADDSYNAIINRYFILGRYAVSDEGRETGLTRLLEDGPYAAESKDQTKRSRGLDDEDWDWFRITPQLYLAIGMEMLDQDEYPEFYDPAAAKPFLEDVTRAVEKGAGLGSDVAGGDDVIKADLTLAFLNRDLASFRRSMATVKEKDYSSLYDDAALTFGLNCGLIPLVEFRAWIDVFREFFPGSQHYFKVVYRAIDKEHYDHALMMAEATAEFFPDEELLLEERDFIRSIIPGLKERKRLRGPVMMRGAADVRTEEERPAA